MPEDERPPRARPSLEAMIGRALRLRCPRCGQGRLYSGWVRMPEKCSVCGLKILREPGYYLGSTYVDYLLTAGVMGAAFLSGRIFFHISSRQLLWPLFAFCVIFPLMIFRHARALWLAFDCQFDKSVLEDPE